jgi:hypothetical protein
MNPVKIEILFNQILMTTNKVELRDSRGLLHCLNGPAVIDIPNNTIEFYWHGLLTKSIGKDPFDIASLPDGFTMHRDVLYHIKDGKLSGYKNGRAAFTADGQCYSVEHDSLISHYSHQTWLTWINDKCTVKFHPTECVKIDNCVIYYEYLSSKDMAAAQIYYHDRFNRVHNLRGPPMVHRNGRLEYEFGYVQRTVNPDGSPSKDEYIYNYTDTAHVEKSYLAEPLSLVNMKQFSAEFPDNQWSQAELDDKVRWFFKTQLTSKQKLDLIINRFLTEDDESKVWKDVHNDLMALLNGNHSLVGWFTNKLGFNKIFTFIQRWCHIAQEYQLSNPAQIRGLYTSVYNHFAQEVIDGMADLYEFMKAVPGADLHQLVDTLMKSKCEADVNWRLVIQACHLGGICFKYLKTVFNSRYTVRHKKSKRYIYNFLVAQLELDTAFDIRGKLLDMALSD